MHPRPAAIVTDIEGTTSDIDFVQKVMFPYSRAALPDYVRAHVLEPEVAPWVSMVASEVHTTPDNLPTVIAALLSWIDADRKHTALKALQGQVWAQAFAEGRFQAHVYPDALAALQRWHAAGVPLYVYSSGSLQAQKLYFGHTEAGDLKPLFKEYFDTMTGPKREAESYRRIAAAIGIEPERLLFLSDIGAELDAAREAGWQTVQIVRGNTPPAPGHAQVASFDEIELAPETGCCGD
jgi:enolase-phosphatase E1